jgi:hypothetical protein
MFLNSSTCFQRHTAHHQELKNCNCSLWFYIRLWFHYTAASRFFYFYTISKLKLIIKSCWSLHTHANTQNYKKGVGVLIKSAKLRKSHYIKFRNNCIYLFFISWCLYQQFCIFPLFKVLLYLTSLFHNSHLNIVSVLILQILIVSNLVCQKRYHPRLQRDYYARSEYWSSFCKTRIAGLYLNVTLILQDTIQRQCFKTYCPPTLITWFQLRVLRKQNNGISITLISETHWSTNARLHAFTRLGTCARSWRLSGINPSVTGLLSWTEAAGAWLWPRTPILTPMLSTCTATPLLALSVSNSMLWVTLPSPCSYKSRDWAS